MARRSSIINRPIRGQTYIWVGAAFSMGVALGQMIAATWGLVFGVLLGLGVGVYFWITDERRIERKRRKRGLCPHCGYDLSGTIDYCPECGWEVYVPERGPRGWLSKSGSESDHDE